MRGRARTALARDRLAVAASHHRPGGASPTRLCACARECAAVRTPAPGGEPTCKPGSVLSSHSSGTYVTARLKRPTRKHARALAAAFRLRLPYLALLQVGFAVPSNVATDAVRSYRTISPLPAPLPALRRFAFCCTFRGLAPPRRYLAPCPPSPDFPPRLTTQRLPGRLSALARYWLGRGLAK